MPVYDCAPDDGTSFNSAADSYNATHTYSLSSDFTDISAIRKIDIKVESNAAVISFKQAGDSSFGDDLKVTTGHHSFVFEDQELSEVRIKNASAGNTADYQWTAFESP